MFLIIFWTVCHRVRRIASIPAPVEAQQEQHRQGSRVDRVQHHRWQPGPNQIGYRCRSHPTGHRRLGYGIFALITIIQCMLNRYVFLPCSNKSIESHVTSLFVDSILM